MDFEGSGSVSSESRARGAVRVCGDLPCQQRNVSAGPVRTARMAGPSVPALAGATAAARATPIDPHRRVSPGPAGRRRSSSARTHPRPEGRAPRLRRVMGLHSYMIVAEARPDLVCEPSPVRQLPRDAAACHSSERKLLRPSFPTIADVLPNLFEKALYSLRFIMKDHSLKIRAGLSRSHFSFVIINPELQIHSLCDQMDKGSAFSD